MQHLILIENSKGKLTRRQKKNGRKTTCLKKEASLLVDYLGKQTIERLRSYIWIRTK